MKTLKFFFDMLSSPEDNIWLISMIILCAIEKKHIKINKIMLWAILLPITALKRVFDFAKI